MNGSGGAAMRHERKWRDVAQQLAISFSTSAHVSRGQRGDNRFVAVVNYALIKILMNHPQLCHT